MDKKVSIIVPCYNCSGKIRKTLETIVCQTYKNIELIAVNDGSTDDTIDELKKYSRYYNGIIKVLDKSNGGPASARNYGVLHATGDYIVFCDSDDILPKNAVQNLVSLMDDNIQMGIASYKRRFYNNCELKKEDAVYSGVGIVKFIEIDVGDWVYDGMQTHSFTPLWNKIYLRNIINDYKIRFNEKIRIGEDVIFNLNYLMKTEKVSLSNDIIYIYNVVSDGTSLTHKFDKNTITSLKEYIINVIGFYNSIRTQNTKYYYGCLKSVTAIYALAFFDNRLTRKIRVKLAKKIVSDALYHDISIKSETDGMISRLIIGAFKKKNYILFYFVSFCIYLSRRYGR